MSNNILDIFLISGILNKNKLTKLANLAIKPAKIRKNNKISKETNGYKTVDCFAEKNRAKSEKFGEYVNLKNSKWVYIEKKLCYTM